MVQMLISRRSAMLGSVSRGSVRVSDRLAHDAARKTGERILANKIAGLARTMAEARKLPALTEGEARVLPIQGPYYRLPSR